MDKNLPKPSKDLMRTIISPLIPVLEVDTSAPIWLGNFRHYSRGTQLLDYVRVKFRYGETVLSPDYKSEFVTLQSGEAVRVMRDREAEAQAVNSLVNYGFEAIPSYIRTPGRIENPPAYALECVDSWQLFVQQVVPQMSKAGWQVVAPPDFRHNVLEVEAWEGEFVGQGNGWFSLIMEIVVGGRRLPLAPLLHAFFKLDPRWLDASQVEEIEDSEPIELLLPDGGRVRVTADRIKPLARTLIELFDNNNSSEILLSRFDLERIDTLTGMERWQFKGVDGIAELACCR